jgi:hypothetical protein
MKKQYWIAGIGTLGLVIAAVPEKRVAFEKEPRLVAAGRSPKYLARRSHGLLMLYTGKSAGGRGQDLFFASSSDLGDSFDEPQRVNHVAGEVSDHGENSPQLLASPDDATLYAVWNARDSKDPSVSHVRFSRSAAIRPSWSPALTVNDDAQPASHNFQGAAVGPDGTIYVAWLDGRNRAGSHDSAHGDHSDQFTGGTSDVYLSRSTDGGKTFERNVKIAANICPCCRVSIGFDRGRVFVAWRQVEAGDIRDIYLAASSNKGQTWGKPVLVARDGWKINGCPHVGPALASLNDRLYVTWFTEAEGKPAINMAWSADGGETFSPKKLISQGTTDPTHPQMIAGEGKLALVFQARDAAEDAGWGKMSVFYREILSDGSLSPLVRAGRGTNGASYPGIALGTSGRIFLGWTETADGKPGAYLLRGRASVPLPLAR